MPQLLYKRLNHTNGLRTAKKLLLSGLHSLLNLPYLVPMKAFFSLFVVALAASATAQTASLEWLSGTWKTAQQVYEVWEIKAPHLVGHSFKVTAEGDTIPLEQLILFPENEGWVYRATVAGNPGPVDFSLTTQSYGSAVFSNPTHDDPQEIVYVLTQTGLEVTLRSAQAGERKMVFEKLR